MVKKKVRFREGNLPVYSLSVGLEPTARTLWVPVQSRSAWRASSRAKQPGRNGGMVSLARLEVPAHLWVPVDPLALWQPLTVPEVPKQSINNLRPRGGPLGSSLDLPGPGQLSVTRDKTLFQLEWENPYHSVFQARGVIGSIEITGKRALSWPLTLEALWKHGSLSLAFLDLWKGCGDCEDPLSSWPFLLLSLCGYFLGFVAQGTK